MRFWILITYLMMLLLFAGIVLAYWLAHLLPVLREIDSAF